MFEKIGTLDLKGIRKIVIVSHTHWDREWYLPFQEYMLNFIALMNRLLKLLHDKRDFKYFLLDGQVSLIEDYLEWHPENKSLLLKYIRNGRIGIGPWYTQPDEWLSHPEALVRNLLFAKTIADELNLPVMKVGYTPDSFGHTAQLPQILRGFNIDSFIFMRGMGDEGEQLGDEFRWISPDGSEVLAVHLLIGYSNAVLLGCYIGHPHEEYYTKIYPEMIKLWRSGLLKSIIHSEIYEREPMITMENLIKQIKWLLESSSDRLKSKCLLLLNGGDHTPPQKNIVDIVKILKKEIPTVKIIHGNFEDYIKILRRISQKLPFFKGEFYAARYHWLFANTLSTRIPQLKIPSYVSQVSIIYYLEPLSTICWLLGDPYPINLIRFLWKLLLRNLAHDSICGCGVDDVYKDVNMRFRHIVQICSRVIHDKLRYLATQINTSRLGEADSYIIVFNPLGWQRDDIVELETILEEGDYIIEDEEGNRFPVAIIKSFEKEIFSKKKVKRILFQVKKLPPLGFKTVKIIRLSNRTKNPIVKCRNFIENEFFKIETRNSQSALIEIFDKNSGVKYKNFNIFIDEGDAGDEYTFCPPIRQETFTNEMVKANVWIEETDCYSCMNIKFKMKIPCCLKEKERQKKLTELKVWERIYLYPGIPRIDLHITISNRAKDHRLCIAFPTGLSPKYLSVDTHFYVINRSPIFHEKHEKIWQEIPPTEHPQLFWIDVSDGERGIMIANRGLPAYKVDHDGTVYLTLLRCVGHLAKSELPTRRGSFPLELPTYEAQCLGRFNFQISIIPHSGIWSTDNTFRQAMNFAVPPLAYLTESKHTGKLNPTESVIWVEPDTIVTTALKKGEKEDTIVFRCYNASEKHEKIILRPSLLKRYIKKVCKTNLSEEKDEKIRLDCENKLSIFCKPWEIVTVKFFKS